VKRKSEVMDPTWEALRSWHDLLKWGRVALGDVLGYRCPACGAITDEPATHRTWHTRLNAPVAAETAALDVEIERMALEWPDWRFMFGYEVYDPIRDSPGETNHRELVGKMVWWAASRTHDELGNLVIKSAERQPSLSDAIRDLRSQLPARVDTR
jgi:hypothetical protein